MVLETPTVSKLKYLLSSCSVSTLLLIKQEVGRWNTGNSFSENYGIQCKLNAVILAIYDHYCTYATKVQ